MEKVEQLKVQTRQQKQNVVAQDTHVQADMSVLAVVTPHTIAQLAMEKVM